jgi:beta-galactosidase
VAQGDGRRVTLSSSDLTAVIEDGNLVSYRIKGEEQLAGPLVPHLWRVPTDNDEGGGDASYAHRWREAGLDRLQAVAQAPTVEAYSTGRARVIVASRLAGTRAAVTVTTTYEVASDGTIAVSAAFVTDGGLPPLPRVGFQLQVPGAYDTARWYGRGPQESYADRKDGARFGLFSSRVADLHFPHVMAQENGNHTDTRFVELVDTKGRGLRISAEGPLDFTAHDYTDAALLAAKKSQVIERDGRVSLSLDLAQMGLGGDDSWTPRVHPEYQLAAREYRFSFRIAPVADGRVD